LDLIAILSLPSAALLLAATAPAPGSFSADLPTICCARFAAGGRGGAAASGRAAMPQPRHVVEARLWWRHHAIGLA